MLNSCTSLIKFDLDLKKNLFNRKTIVFLLKEQKTQKASRGLVNNYLV